MLTPSSGDLVELACRLARLHGLERVIVDRGLDDAELDRFDPDLGLIVIAGSETPAASAKRWYERRVRWRVRAVPIGADIVARSVVLAHLPSEESDDGARLGPLLSGAPVAIVSVSVDPMRPGPDPASLLHASGAPVTFVGHHAIPSGSLRVAISDRVVGNGSDRAPSDFRVVAIMTAYNEEDIVGPSIERLRDQGIGVYLIDNWSTDRTFEIAGRYLGNGVVGIERYPGAPSPTFDLADILARVERVAAETDATWIIHHDADERRGSPWVGQSLRDGLWTAHRAGFDAVDHTVLSFPPVDDSFRAGADMEPQFRFFEFASSPGDHLKIQAWRQRGQRVALAPSGGHEAAFEGRRVFPYKFLLRHYSIRSQTHGERKILVERQARWNAQERARGWHLHYDDIAPGFDFTRDPNDLIEYRPGATERDYLVPFISGVGLAVDGIPSWARSRRAGWWFYRGIRAANASRASDALRRSPALRNAARGIKARLMGRG